MPSEPTSKRDRRAAAREAREQAERDAASAATRKRRLRMLLLALAGAAALVGVAIVVSSQGGDDASGRPALAQTATGAIPGEAEAAALLDGIPQRGTVLGDPDAPVRLTEFADLQCPICRAHVLEVMPAIVRDYVRTGKVSIDLQLLAFIGEDSVEAGRAGAAAAAQNRLWYFTDIFYANQGEENSGYVTDAFLRSVESAAGLDSAKAAAYADSDAAEQALTSADALAQRHEVEGTPTFLIARGDAEPQKIDELGVEAMRAAIDERLR